MSTLPPLRFDDRGLLAVVVQDRLTGELRMLAHANREALEATLKTGEAHFFSRSRQALWRKGESSGNVLRVREVWADCDGDAVVYLADPTGPTCHTGAASCFFQRVGEPTLAGGEGDTADPDPAGDRARSVLPTLWSELEVRTRSTTQKSYTKSLLDGGAGKIGAKIREEAEELAEAIASESDERVIAEAADELYHLLVGLLWRGLSLRDLERELARRFGSSGHVEKASRAR